MDIVCAECGSDNLVRDPDAAASAGEIPLLCQDCGWRGTRTPNVSCPRCGSRAVDSTAVDSWAYEDLEVARERPHTAPWGYVDKTIHRCQKCHHEWTVSGQYRPYNSRSEPTTVVFHNDDAGYQAWLAASPRGYVLHCEAKPNANYLMLHRASCATISSPPPGATTHTGDYIKVCSIDRATLKQWAHDATNGGETTPCQHCM